MIAYDEIQKFPDDIGEEIIKAIDILKAEGANKIILFGSIVKNKFKDDYSDIDFYLCTNSISKHTHT